MGVFVGRDDGMLMVSNISYKLDINKNIRFLGPVLEVQYLWKISDISILPSHEEGFSNSLLEAMSFGIPSIVTNVGGNIEAIKHGHSGLIVKKEAPQELAKALLMLINDKKLRNFLGNNALKRVRSKFNFKNTIEI